MFRSSIHRLLGAAIILSSVSSAWALDPFDGNQPQSAFFLKNSNTWSQLAEAVRDTEAAPSIKSLLSQSTAHSLSVLNRVSGEFVETTKFQHYFQGLEVVGSMAFHHRGFKGTEISDRIKTFNLDTQPSLSVETAVAIAKSEAGDRNLSRLPELKILPQDQDNSANLVYWVNLDRKGAEGGRELIIDAHSGQVIGNLSKHLTIAPVSVYTAKNQGISISPVLDPSGKQIIGCTISDLATKQSKDYDSAGCDAMLKGGLNVDQACQVNLDGDPILVQPLQCKLASRTSAKLMARIKSMVNEISDEATARGASNSKQVLQYYFNQLGRDSYDNHGSEVISVVHAGESYDNAHWDTEAHHMVYGDGDGNRFGDFTLALDVAGHELTHGVTDDAVHFVSMGESGSLSEGYSDFFGKMVENSGDWVIGRKLFLKPTATSGIRDLADPHHLLARGPNEKKVPYPATYKEKFPIAAKCDDSNDYCWIHANATIFGHAGYLVFQAIGKEKAEKLYYTVVTQAISSHDTIKNSADATRKICAQMYDQDTCKKVDNALDQVGI